MELKEIPIEKVLANFYQPRIKFDKEKIQELAESILSNGLINPITVREWKGGRFMIVSGERRWRAYKFAKLKTILAFVKEYKDDGQFMVDSLIENIHREDLSPTEKGKFCLKIKKQMKLETNEQIAKKLSMTPSEINIWVDAFEFGKKLPRGSETSLKILRSTRSLPDKERKEIIKFAEKEGKSGSYIEEEFMPVYKKSDEPTRKALLSGRVTIDNLKEPPEPIQLERTANDIICDILSNLDNFRHNVNELKETNIKDIGKKEASQSMTTAGLHMKTFIEFVNIIRRTGTKPNPLILNLIKEKNGKV